MNAIILAAGTSSRFVPLSTEYPKGLLEVRGEILIERQIRQLQEAGIYDITIVLGYMAEKFSYLETKYGVNLVINTDYQQFNNTSSIIRVINKLADTYICSSDNYFPQNVFCQKFDKSYYSAIYAKGKTNEYCLSIDKDNNIIGVSIGGKDSWYMNGHVFFNKEFSLRFRSILETEYLKEKTKSEYWEDVYIRHIDNLPKMKINMYKENEIYEFDSIDELRQFDKSYINDTRSSIVKEICKTLKVKECNVHDFQNIKHNGNYLLFNFKVGNILYQYNSLNEINIKRL